MYETYDVRGDELGRGAFGAVIKALHMQEGKYYAIKMILHERMEPGTDLADTIMREVAVMQRVGLHRHICHLKEFFAEEDELGAPSLHLVRVLRSRSRSAGARACMWR